MPGKCIFNNLYFLKLHLSNSITERKSITLLIWINDSTDYISMLSLSISFTDSVVQLDDFTQHLQDNQRTELTNNYFRRNFLNSFKLINQSEEWNHRLAKIPSTCLKPRSTKAKYAYASVCPLSLLSTKLCNELQRVSDNHQHQKEKSKAQEDS